MAAYEYICTWLHKVSAQTVGEICEELGKSEAGLSPKTLLDASRDENSPLHNEFDWDDTVAAEKWRLEQARILIAHVRIVYSDTEQEQKAIKERGFVSTPGRQSVYVSMDTALHNENYRNYLLQQAKRDSENFLAKYRRVQELSRVVEEMDRFLKG